MTAVEVGLFKLKSVQLPENAYNTFFYLNQNDIPTNTISRGSDIVALHLRYGNDMEKSYYTSLGPFLPQVPSNYIGASPAVILRLGLKEDSEIFVSLSPAKALSVLSVRPKCNDDYNILVNLHNIMENIILYQVRIVAPSQCLPLKVGNIVVDMVVEKIKPNGDCGRLEQYTEIVVLDPTAEDSEKVLAVNYPHLVSLPYLLWKLYHWGSHLFGNPVEDENSEKTTPQDILAAALKDKKKLRNEYRVVLERDSTSSGTVYVSGASGFETETPCKITKLPEKSVLLQSSSKSKPDSFICCMVASNEVKTQSKNLVRLTKTMMKRLDVSIGSRIIIEKIPSLPKENDCHQEQDSREEETEKEGNIYLWNSIENIRCQVVRNIDSSVNLGHKNNILITGPSGCGKSFFLKAIADHCTKQDIFCSIVQCKKLRGKKIESILKIFCNKFSECAYRDPSVLIFDDLDALMYLSEEEDVETGQSAGYCKRIASILTDLFESFAEDSKICLLATACSVPSLGPSLASTRGPKLFGCVLKVPELSAEERREMLERFGASVSPDLLTKTHGYRIQDIADLISRAKLQTVVAGREILKVDDINTALEYTVPMALRGVQLKADVPYKWSDVGGMQDLKTTLDEIFRWHSQFPEVFASCPLKLQTGALLYGPPGCGKTLIAGALANECGMNFKSVKGPELLSKYVGASEAAVRNLFEAAQQARPCLLFFDELDSLAPRRGADSTGVTDRVVNQLLTELDGVEGRAGVWVLGASSRPDLIDPALLRPGRLDRVIFCPLPTAKERLRILEVLSKSLQLSEAVSLDEIVSQTDGFTGADLQALLYNCQMKAIQEQPDDVEDAELIVEVSHVKEAFKETKSSLSQSERIKYEKIFERFQVAKRSKKVPYVMDQPQKVTFA